MVIIWTTIVELSISTKNKTANRWSNASSARSQLKTTAPILIQVSSIGSTSHQDEQEWEDRQDWVHWRRRQHPWICRQLLWCSRLCLFPHHQLTRKVDFDKVPDLQLHRQEELRDNFFVWACIQLGIFAEEEIQKIRRRAIPSKMINEIAIEMKCRFLVYHADDTRNSRHQRQLSINTCKNPKVVADRVVKLLLYKYHYMIDNYEILPITKYYIEHRNELDEKYPISELFMIKNKSGDKSNNGTEILTVLATMFANSLFREINQCEKGILSTIEFDNLEWLRRLQLRWTTVLPILNNRY